MNESFRHYTAERKDEERRRLYLSSRIRMSYEVETRCEVIYVKKSVFRI